MRPFQQLCHGFVGKQRKRADDESHRGNMLTVLAVCVVGGLGMEGSVKGVIMLVEGAHCGCGSSTKSSSFCQESGGTKRSSDKEKPKKLEAAQNRNRH